MEIILTHKESEEFFYNALCNGLGYIQHYGLELDYKKADYQSAKSKLESLCYEDVLMQILKDGNILTLTDIECDGEYTRSITLDDVHSRVQKTPIGFLMDMINENYDAETCDVVIQSVFYGDIIFG